MSFKLKSVVQLILSSAFMTSLSSHAQNVMTIPSGNDMPYHLCAQRYACVYNATSNQPIDIEDNTTITYSETTPVELFNTSYSYIISSSKGGDIMLTAQ